MHPSIPGFLDADAALLLFKSASCHMFDCRQYMSTYLATEGN